MLLQLAARLSGIVAADMPFQGSDTYLDGLILTIKSNGIWTRITSGPK